jgi:DnaJ-class molecular chaperone
MNGRGMFCDHDPCEKCEGSGQVVGHEVCPRCDGQGYVEQEYADGVIDDGE